MSKYTRFIILLLIPTLLYTIFTYPLIFKFNTSFYSAYSGDLSAYITNPNHNTFESFNGLFFAAWPLISSTSTLTATNSLIFLSFILTFITAYWLFFTISKPKNHIFPTTFAVLITISPLRLKYAQEWFNYSQWEFIFIYLVFLIKFILNINLKSTFVLNLMLGLVFLSNPFVGVLTLFSTFPLIAYKLIKKLSISKIFVMCICFTLFTIIPMLLLYNPYQISSKL